MTDTHWVGDAPTSLHGNGAASFDRTTRVPTEVTCALCRTLLSRTEPADPLSCWWDCEDGEEEWSEWLDHDFDTFSGACVNCHMVPETDDSEETGR